MQALGFRSGYGFPLRLRERTLGAINLYQRSQRRPLGEADLLVVRAEAYERLRGHAREHSRKVREVAVDVLEGRIKEL